MIYSRVSLDLLPL